MEGSRTATNDRSERGDADDRHHRAPVVAPSMAAFPERRRGPHRAPVGRRTAGPNRSRSRPRRGWRRVMFDGARSTSGRRRSRGRTPDEEVRGHAVGRTARRRCCLLLRPLDPRSAAAASVATIDRLASANDRTSSTRPSPSRPLALDHDRPADGRKSARVDEDRSIEPSPPPWMTRWSGGRTGTGAPRLGLDGEHGSKPTTTTTTTTRSCESATPSRPR